MNNKEFVSELTKRLGYSPKETSRLLEASFSIMLEQLQNDSVIAIQGFGSFEVRKKAERISVNPATQIRMLVPPKLTLTYKPSTVLKDKFKKR